MEHLSILGLGELIRGYSWEGNDSRLSQVDFAFDLHLHEFLHSLIPIIKQGERNIYLETIE